MSEVGIGRERGNNVVEGGLVGERVIRSDLMVWKNDGGTKRRKKKNSGERRREGKRGAEGMRHTRRVERRKIRW